jgi:hypothetical protein
VVQKFRKFDRREEQNIFELEIDEIMADEAIEGDGQLLVLKILNSFSSRFFSFTVPVEGEGFINSFFRFLDSFDRNVEIF